METMTVPASDLAVSMEMVPKEQYDNMVASRDIQKERASNLERQIDRFHSQLIQDVEDGAIEYDTAVDYAEYFGLNLTKEINVLCTVTYSFVASVPGNYNVSDLDISVPEELECNDSEVEIRDVSIDSQELDEF